MTEPRLTESEDAPEGEYWGAGPAPPLTETHECKCVVEASREGDKLIRIHGAMKVEVSPVRAGPVDAPIATWGWRCRNCRRYKFGGRWRE